MIIYGGATGGGSLASDDLYLLDLRSGEESATWMVVPIVGTTPGRRYGHTAVFSKPHLLTFGGNTVGANCQLPRAVVDIVVPVLDEFDIDKVDQQYISKIFSENLKLKCTM